MKRLLTILAALLCTAAQAGCNVNPDRNMQSHDKVSHVKYSAAIGAAVQAADARFNWNLNAPQKLALALTPGLVREVLQGCTGKQAERSGFSPADMVANTVGAVIGLTVAGLVIERSNGSTVVSYRASF